MSEVVWKKLEDLLDYEQPSKYIVKSTDYVNRGIPVLTAGQSFLLGYTEEEDGVYYADANNPVIIFDDFTTSFHLVCFNFKVKSSALKILFAKNNVNIRLVYNLMKNISYEPKEHSRQWLSIYSKFEVGLPLSKTQQQAIVNQLDTFTSLISRLESELELRQKQYEHYREELLSFEGDEEVEWKTLGDIGDVAMCKRIFKEQTQPQGEIPFYKIGTFGKTADAFISRELYEDFRSKYKYPKIGDILMSASGSIGRTVVYDGSDAYYQDSNIVWIENDESIVSNKFLRLIYSITKWNVDNGGVIARLYNKNIRSTIIPIPRKNRQQQIVDKLDMFEQLIAALKREIALRKKQYTYYREKLLTFE